MNFDGKTIIVTGAGGGIGEVYARGCARQGMNVVVAELSQEKGASVADSINEEGGKASFQEKIIFPLWNLEEEKEYIEQQKRYYERLQSLEEKSEKVEVD